MISAIGGVTGGYPTPIVYPYCMLIIPQSTRGSSRGTTRYLRIPDVGFDVAPFPPNSPELIGEPRHLWRASAFDRPRKRFRRVSTQLSEDQLLSFLGDRNAGPVEEGRKEKLIRTSPLAYLPLLSSPRNVLITFHAGGVERMQISREIGRRRRVGGRSTVSRRAQACQLIATDVRCRTTAARGHEYSSPFS